MNESRPTMTTASDDDIPATLDPRLQAHIGRKLREHYDEIIAQPVPDRFMALLDQLERRESRIAAPEQAEAAGDDGTPEYGR